MKVNISHAHYLGIRLQSSATLLAQMWVTYKSNHRALHNTMKNGCKSQRVGTQTLSQICIFHCIYTVKACGTRLAKQIKSLCSTMTNGTSHGVGTLQIDLRDSAAVMFKYAKNVYLHYFPLVLYCTVHPQRSVGCQEEKKF